MGANGLLNQKVAGVFRYNYGFKQHGVQLGNRKQEAHPHDIHGAAAIVEIQIQIGLRDLPRQTVSAPLPHYVMLNDTTSRPPLT